MSNNNQKQENIPNISLDEINIRWKPEDCAFFSEQAMAWSSLQKRYSRAYLIQLANINSVIMERVMMYGFDD